MWGCHVKRVVRILLWVIGITFGVLGLGWIAIRGYLNSSYGQRMASQQLSQLVGTTVEVESLGIGTTTTSISLRVPDPSPVPQGDLVKIGSLQADVSLLQLLTRQVSPSNVTINDVEILLRLDADGNRLTAFPKFAQTGSMAFLPAILLNNLRFRIQQAGHPEFDLGGISGRLKRDGEAYILTGNLDDQKWGKWGISGRLNAAASDGQIVLQAEGAPLSDALLRSIPYVPSEVWDEFTASGQTVATITLTLQPGRDLGYRVDLHPKKATLSFPSAEITVSDFVGQILVEDGRVNVEGGVMKLADGTITLKGFCDFKKSDRVIAMTLTTSGVDVTRLPQSWGLPKKVEGKLRGNANLELHIDGKGKLEPRGSGSGDIEEAKFAGINAQIELKLKSRDGRFRFEAVK